MHQDTTEHLGLPLPHPNNRLQDDVLHLREAMHGIDRALYQHSQATTALGESVQDITPEITAQLQAQTLALGTQMQAGTQTVTDAVAAQAQATTQDITQAMGTGLTAQAQAIQNLAGDVATRASAQQLHAAFAAHGQLMGAALAQGSHNFPFVKTFLASQVFTFTRPGTIFLRGVGAGAGGFSGSDKSKSGAAAGWGQVVKEVAAGDVLTCIIGAGGLAGSFISGARVDADSGGDTVIDLQGQTYIAAGGAGVSASDPITPLPAKHSSGPWDFCVDGRILGYSDVVGVTAGISKSFDEQPQGWGVRINPEMAAPPFIGGLAGNVSYRGRDGGLGAGGGAPGTNGYHWAGNGGNGVVIMYFWPQTNP